MAVSSATNGHCLPLQVIFQGITSKTLPKFEGSRKDCELSGWNITYTYNHSPTLETCKEFEEKILQPYLEVQIQLLQLPTDHEKVWLIDSWSVLISKDFRN